MLDKKLKILIEIIKNGKDSYTSEEIQDFLGLKFVEGVYPYIKGLKEYVKKTGKGKYSLISHKEKINDLRRIVSIYHEGTELLLDSKVKGILIKFKSKKIISYDELNKKDISLIKELIKKTHTIHEVSEDGKKYIFLCSYDEPIKSLLNFLDIELDYSSEELKLDIQKYYSNLPNTEIPVTDEEQAELRRMNIEYYLLGKDLILNRLSETNFNFLVVSDELTKKKKSEFNNNPFVFTTKLDNWRLQYIYNTDRIEGNVLTLEQVKSILTVGSDTSEIKKEVLETINSRTALERIFNTNNELNEDFIKKLHLAIQNSISKNAGEYKIRENCIRDSEGNLMDRTTPASFVKERMDKLIRWYNDNKNKLHTFVLASVFHNQFVYIHPFDDGNGRLARLLFNFILIKDGYFPIIFYNHDKEEYYARIRTAKSGNVKDFVSYCSGLYAHQIEAF